MGGKTLFAIPKMAVYPIPKSETRNPKQSEQARMTKARNSLALGKVSQSRNSFWKFEGCLRFDFVSNFGFRASCFHRAAPRAAMDGEGTYGIQA
jgi:hypothetical protein